MTWESLARPQPVAHGSPLYNRVAASELWIAQMKVDGWRVLVEVDRAKRIKATSRHGKPVDLASGAVAGLASVPAMSALDAEYVSKEGALYVFDVLTLAGADMTGLPMSTRSTRLGAVVEEGEHVHVVRNVRDRKEDYYQALVSQGAEGMVLKRLADPYPARGVVWLKVKPCLC